MTKTIALQLKDLETPAFKRALAALTDAGDLSCLTVGQIDRWLTHSVDAEAALAWRTYKNLEDLLP